MVCHGRSLHCLADPHQGTTLKPDPNVPIKPSAFFVLAVAAIEFTMMKTVKTVTMMASRMSMAVHR